MNTSLPSIDAPIGTARRRWLGWLLLGVVFALAVVAAVAINTLGSRADAIRRTEAGLTRLEKLTYHLSAIEWEAIKTGSLTTELSEETEEARRQMSAQMSELNAMEFRIARLPEIQARFMVYERNVEREFEMLAAGNIAEAEEWDETEVDPAFDELIELITDVRATFDPLVVGVLTEVRRWTYLIVLAALGSMAILFWQFHRSQLTYLKRTQEEMREARDHAELANESKSKFLASMSHELRTPLNAILGYSEMLQEDETISKNPEVLGDVRKIHSSGSHLLALINDILDLSKIEAGRMTVSPEEFELLALIRETIDSVRPIAEKNGNSIGHDHPQEMGKLHTDAIKVRQILLNLVTNACKFTNNGTITVSSRRFVHGGIELVQVSVTDNGIGLSPEQIERLFKDYSQAEETTSRLFGGTGLGLSISRRLCLMLGGDISVQSEPGSGSSFSFHFPARYSAAAAGAQSGAIRIAGAVPAVQRRTPSPFNL